YTAPPQEATMNARTLSLAFILLVTVSALAGPPIEVTIPAGTQVHFKLKQTINTANAKVGEHVAAELTAPLVAGTKTVAATGAPATVRISSVEASGRVGGSAKLVFSLVSVTLANGSKADIRTSSFAREGKAHAKH